VNLINTKGGFFSGFQSIHTHANQTQSFAIIASESEGKKKQSIWLPQLALEKA
jgi:hypothetical protein